MKNVVVVQYRLLHYRTELFELLAASCKKCGIVLNLVHGQPTRRELSKRDTGALSWAVAVNNSAWEIGNRDLIWQPMPKHLRDADLVIVMQENRLLSNYWLLLKRHFGNSKLAYWGHGVNFQSQAPTGLRERWKRFFLTRIDWWFAYTQLTADIVKNAGYSADRITCLNNAIDNKGFKTELAAIGDARLNEARQALGITTNAQVGIFCGSLYPDKKLEFTVDAAAIVQRTLPDFHLVVIGDGPSMSYMQEAAKSRPWIHLLGVKTGDEKALYFRLANFMFNPGAVGLHVLDAFCAGLVLLTTSTAKHGPEIAYLQHNVNGYLTADSVEDYADTLVQLAKNPARLAEVKACALADSNRYSLENMVSNFTDGICKCLNTPRLK